MTYDVWFFQFVYSKLGVECEWNNTGVDLVVVDKTNPTMRFEQLLDFFNTLDVPNLGEGNLREMFEAGFELPEDIIDLAVDDVASLVGSRSIGKKIHQGLHAKLKNIPIYQLMGAHPAFGRGVGVRKMKKLWEAFEGDMSMCSDLSNITAVDGFDTKTATKVMLGLPVFDAFLSNLGDLITIQPYEKVVGGAMDGKVVVFTGFRSKDLELAVERAGGKMGSGVSSKTTYVVTENPSDGSTKLTKARELSIPIISVGELRAML